MSTPLNEIAAAIHADMCNDERNGYSWEERWGQYGSSKTLYFDGLPYTYNLGDRDCSSSCIEAWRLAVTHTPWEGCFDGATYTGNMRSVFTASGLFDVWDTGSTCAERGDLYLNDECHVAMCQYPDPDTLSEFSWGDVGAYGNQRGDQSGWESHITGFYDYPWWCTLHYNHAADGSQGGEPTPAPEPEPAPAPSGDQPRYRVSTDPAGASWYDEMCGRTDTGGSGDDFGGAYGEAMRWLAIGGVGQYRVCTQDSGWLPWVDQYDVNDLEYGCAGDGSPIIAVEISNGSVRYAVHDLGGGWNPPMIGNWDSGGSGDWYAGSMVPADAIWLEWA